MEPTRLYSGTVEVDGYEYRIECNICPDYVGPDAIETEARIEGLEDVYVNGAPVEIYTVEFITAIKEEIINGFENGTIE